MSFHRPPPYKRRATKKMNHPPASTGAAVACAPAAPRTQPATQPPPGQPAPGVAPSPSPRRLDAKEGAIFDATDRCGCLLCDVDAADLANGRAIVDAINARAGGS